MADEEVLVEGPTAQEIFDGYFKKSRGVLGVLNYRIFWQLYSDFLAEGDDNNNTQDISSNEE